MPVAGQNFRDWRAAAQSFEGLTAYRAQTSTVRGGDRPHRASVASVTEDFVKVFRLVPVSGRSFGPEDYQPGSELVALVGEETWTRELGQQPLDDLRLEIGGDGYQVVGLLPSGFGFPQEAQVWLPLQDDNPSRSAHNYSVVGRLAEGRTVDQADGELDALQDRITASEQVDDPEYIASAVLVQPLREAVSGRAGGPLGLLFGAAGLVLLIACSNLASTLLARGALRTRELTVRQAVGATRGRLTRQLLTESCLLATLGGVVGLALAQASIVALKATEGVGLPRIQDVSLDLLALGFAALASLLTGVLFGLLPAIRMSSRDPGTALRSSDRSQADGKRSKLWGPLVAAEVALAFVLLAGSLLLVKSFQRLLSTERGFETAGVMTVDIDLNPTKYVENSDHIQFYRLLLDDLEARGDIEAAGIVSSVPLSGRMPDGRLELDGDLSTQASAGYAIASSGYFQAMGIPLLQGRSFNDGDRESSAHVAIVSRSFADQYWPGEDPIGRQVSGGGMDEFWETRDFATVVGVVGDARYYDLVQEPGPVAYFPFSQRPGRLTGAATIVSSARRGGAEDLVPTLRTVLQAHDPDIPPRFRSMEDRIRGAMAQRRFLVSLLGGFAIIALALSGLGIYGVVSFSVARRTREMGIRIALGGQRDQIRTMVQLQSLRSVLAGGALGLVAALGLGRVLESALFEVNANDPLTLLAATVLLLATAWLATWIPALRSTRVDPLTAMRVD